LGVGILEGGATSLADSDAIKGVPMPTTAAAVLVIVVAIIPGALGSHLYAVLNGLDWRRKEWDTAIRYIAFSILGLVLYVLLAEPLHWLPAAHVIPDPYTDPRLQTGSLARLAVPWLVKGSAPDRWVVVTLKAGDVFAGVVRVADVGVPTEDRDLILGEPALLDPTTGKYIVTPYHEIFLPAALIQNLAVLPRANDARIGPGPGAELFPKEDAHVTQASSGATPTPPAESGGEGRERGISPQSATGSP
jgi:hypothetical protein